MFDARHQDAASSRVVSLRSPSSAPSALGSDILGKVGESFAGSLSMLLRRLATLGPLPAAQQDILQAGIEQAARLEQLGVQIQELVRVIDGDRRLPTERLDLSRAIAEALAGHDVQVRSGDVTLTAPAQALEVDVNAAALSQLLDLAFGFAMRIGSRIAVTSVLEGVPRHPCIVVTVQRAHPPMPGRTDDELDEVHWLLFAHGARAIGLAPNRVVEATVVTLSLGFVGDPPMPKAEGDATLSPRTASAVGRRVLVVEPQEMFRVQAHRLIAAAGIDVNTVATLEQGHGTLGHWSPDLVVTGFAVTDRGCAELLDALRAAQPRLRVVELVDDDSAFAFSAPGVDHPARVGRQDLARTLVPALAQELDAAWSP